MKFIDVSKKNPRYFEREDGTTFLPIGLNLCFVRNSESKTEEEVLELYRFWMTEFAKNGGNFIRVWLGVPFFDIMPERSGEFCEKNISHIRFIVESAEQLGIKIKFTLEHFRRVGKGKNAESFPGVVSFDKPLYSSYCSTMKEYLASPECRKLYLDKARRLAAAGFGDSKAVIAWELWNEINCIGRIEDIGPWSDYMLEELAKIFPRQMIVQNLGSFSGSTAYRIYDYLGKLPNNGFLQVHRYLDPGAELDVCRGPMDVLSADSIRELHDRNPNIPAILAEGGAVEANHIRYSDAYEQDREGVLLHDVIFAPFFVGSAGCGQCWHWDYIYIQKHNLYWHFSRFAAAVKNVDPAAEEFEPFYTETHKLRVYGLRGKTMDLLWCRDKKSDWQSELVEGIPAEAISDEKIPVSSGSACRFYMPWSDVSGELSSEDSMCVLPPFTRSIVVRCVKR